MLTRDQIERLSDEDLCVKICEEASEVIKAVCKHHNHGPTPKFKGVQYDNVRDANEEASQFNDLMWEYRYRFGAAGHRGVKPCVE